MGNLKNPSHPGDSDDPKGPNDPNAPDVTHRLDASNPANALNPSDTAIVKTTAQIGERVRRQRTQLGLRQIDLAGLGNTGNRFIVDLERGKPTVQLQKVMDTLALLGLELVVRPKTGGIV